MCGSAHDRIHAPPKSSLECSFKSKLKLRNAGSVTFKYPIASGDERPRVQQPDLFHHRTPIRHDEAPTITDADTVQECYIGSTIHSGRLSQKSTTKHLRSRFSQSPA